ncbi:unnamed protein product [Clavelina lepadiformis]|uniref:N-acyl-aliphatic-L-amino acid amidohydrolase n=1 Tax=Clavelina lepadiformis TaxID=159417 RepID=A0ABP0GAZ0_CLALP
MGVEQNLHIKVVQKTSYHLNTDAKLLKIQVHSIMTKDSEPLSVTLFREYLRIKTVHPNPDYAQAIAFLDKYAQDLGLECRLIETCDKDHTVVLMTWKGKDSTLPSILLNSHTDVVPVYEEHWKYDAFAAVKEENGDIYARGTQDMKCVGIQYLEAIRKLKNDGYHFDRDIHLSFVPDEEIGGFEGMLLFLQSQEFKALNVGLALDEGLASPDDDYVAYYGERSPWWARVKCEGNPGHGSRFIENTAAEKLRKVINSFLDYRESQKLLMESTCQPLGDVTTVNLTRLEGGIANNIVPAELSATFDIRIPPTVDLQEFEQKLQGWCRDAGEGVSIEFLQKNIDQTVTATDSTNPWWVTFSSAIKECGKNLKVEVFSGATDSRFLRKAGYNAIGFSPMRNTPVLLHDHNEFLNEAVFLEGIDTYCSVIKALANMKP